MLRIRLSRAPFLAALGLAVVACGAPELPPSSPASGGPLAGCQMDDDGQARTWMCGDLVAQELAAESATEAEARLVLEKFASDFVEAKAVRTDVRWSLGADSFPSVRLEGTTAAGRRFTAQMVVISRPGDARVVQCASNSPTAPCEPVLDHLVKSGPAAAAP
jgi:hypothetical protein